MHIAVDLDDVVLDFMGGVRRAVETEYGVDMGEWDRWEMGEVLNPILGESWWKWMRRRDWLWPNFPAIPGAIGSLEILRRDGHYLECVTSKPDWAEAAVWKWLGKWRPPFNAVTIMSGDVKKSSVTKADLIIDDRAENVNDFIGAGRMAWLLDRPHNQTVRLAPMVERKKNWAHIVESCRRYTEVEEAIASGD